MASLSTSAPPITGSVATTAVTRSLQKQSRVTTLSRRIHSKHALLRRISCKSTNDDDAAKPKLDRRDILLGLGGLYGAAGLPLAFANPIQPPDLSKCGAADIPASAEQINCCPPFSSTIIDYVAPVGGPLRTRPAAHAVDSAYIAKFNLAMQRMRALPDSDPRSFKQQANVHCAYCDGAYEQVGFPDLDIQVHNSWLFFPFHRWYLYFFERILGSLINDPTFAMPFWNWDLPAGMPMPAIYADRRSPLYDQFRNQNHLPPRLLDLDYNGRDDNSTNAAQISANLAVMYRQMVANGRSATMFLGQAYRAGDDTIFGGGSVEGLPHGPVHMWTGDNRQPNGEDMGNFFSAGRDPIFYAHHSNVDRMWSLWKTIDGGRRQDFTDRDWLDAAFVFYDEKSRLVRVKVGDCLDERKLGYVYQKMETPWLTARPTPRRSVTDRIRQAIGGVPAARADEYPTVKFPVTLDKQIKTLVKRPTKKRSQSDKDAEDEVLVIEGIEIPRDVAIKFDVFINDEDDAPTGADKSEFAGSFVHVPHTHNSKTALTTNLRLDITELLEDLDAEGDEYVVVTLEPKIGTGHIKIRDMKIEFVS